MRSRCTFEDVADIRTSQAPFGHRDVKTTLIYTHELQCDTQPDRPVLSGGPSPDSRYATVCSISAPE